MQGANGHMLCFHRCLSCICISELMTDCNDQPLVDYSVSTCYFLVFIVTETTFSGGPISGALLTSQYKWLIPSIFCGVSCHFLHLREPCAEILFTLISSSHYSEV